MKVLHIITRLIRGGAQENTVATAILHQRMGVTTEILHGPTDASREGEVETRARAAGVILHRLPALQREPSLLDVTALIAISRFLRRRSYDVVHTHTSKAGFLGRLAARLAPVPVVVHTPHGHVFHSYYGPLRTRLYVRIERCAAPWADRMVALTRRERDEHLDYGIGESSSFTIVPSGIDVERFRRRPHQREDARRALDLGPDPFVIGCVGRLTPIKGQDTLLRALPLVVRSIPDVRLLLVGDGESREPLQHLAQSLGVSRLVTFLGHRSDPAAIWPAFDVAAVPSLNEGMGRVLLEAFAAEVPVVASLVGGIPDVVDNGRTGRLVTPGRPAELARALIAVHQERERTQQMVAKAADDVGPQWSQQAMAERLLKLYQELLRR